MPSRGRRSFVALLAVAALVGASAGSASSAPLHAASAFNPKGIYDCSVLQAITGIRVYVTTFVFKSGHRYSNGLKGPGRSLAGSVSNGRYKRVGSKIVPLSGRLKKLHETLLIQQADLAVLDSKGHFTSLGCFQRGAATTQPGSGTPGPGSFPVGSYNCYHTVQEPGGGFFQGFAADITFWSDGTYSAESPRGAGWRQHGNEIDFTAGPLAGGFHHDVGTWSPGGVALPNATGTFAGNQFTLVLRGTQPNEALPPSSEFTGSVPSSFYYCKKRAGT